MNFTKIVTDMSAGKALSRVEAHAKNVSDKIDDKVRDQIGAALAGLQQPIVLQEVPREAAVADKAPGAAPGSAPSKDGVRHV